MDLNHDKQIQSLLCYHYTIRHCECGKDSRFGGGVKELCDAPRLRVEGKKIWHLNIA